MTTATPATPEPNGTQPTGTPTETPAPTNPTSPPASASTDSPAAPTTTDLTEADKPAEPSTDLGAEETPTETPGAAFQGAPPEGEDYQLVAPDGMAVDEELAAEFRPLARELNLNQAGVQKLVDLKAKDIQNQLKRWGNHLVDLKTTAQADPEIGGAEYPKAVSVAKEAISKFGTPAFRKMLNDYGVGAHPEMIRFMRKVGLAMGEKPALETGGNAGVTANKPLHEILYKD